MSSEVALFSATLSRPMKIMTYALGYGVGIVLPAIIGVNMARTSSQAWPLLIPLATAALLIVSSLFRPLRYAIDADEIRVERPIGPIRVPFDRIESVADATPLLAARIIGIFRVGGFYGTYGRFRNSTLGLFDLYFTGEPQMLAIRRRGTRPLVIGPDEPRRFAETLEQRARARGFRFPVGRPAHPAASEEGGCSAT